MERRYPMDVLEKLAAERERLERSFSRIWGLLHPSQERDEVMLHILKAKMKIHAFIKEQEELK